jgi:hypothetical protein
VKLSVVYIILRPFFHTGEFSDTLPIFPGSSPGQIQFFPTVEHYPDLDIERAIIRIPPVRPGDYIFWYCDLVHGVDPINPGRFDSSVLYNACNPLIPYNIDSLLSTVKSFKRGDVPADFSRSYSSLEREYQHDDCSAKVENVLSKEGLQAIGLERLDEDEEGLSEGQRAV